MRTLRAYACVCCVGWCALCGWCDCVHGFYPAAAVRHHVTIHSERSKPARVDCVHATGAGNVASVVDGDAGLDGIAAGCGLGHGEHPSQSAGSTRSNEERHAAVATGAGSRHGPAPESGVHLVRAPILVHVHAGTARVQHVVRVRVVVKGVDGNTKVASATVVAQRPAHQPAARGAVPSREAGTRGLVHCDGCRHRAQVHVSVGIEVVGAATEKQRLRAPGLHIALARPRQRVVLDAASIVARARVEIVDVIGNVLSRGCRAICGVEDGPPASTCLEVAVCNEGIGPGRVDVIRVQRRIGVVRQQRLQLGVRQQAVDGGQNVVAGAQRRAGRHGRRHWVGRQLCVAAHAQEKAQRSGR
eukprot:m.63333 g.63333  ORF g.63333 m.63333 type:complete len:358 (+) comp16351_c0_seq4:819-1892(+)